MGLRMPGLSRLSIGKQIPLLLGGTLFISLLFAGILATNQITQISDQQIDNLGKALAKQTAKSARDLLITGDRLSLNVLLAQLTNSEHIAQATIFSIDNKRIASTQARDYNPDKHYALFSAPIDYQNVIAGQLRLAVDMEKLQRPTQKALLVFIGLALLLGITGTVIAWNYARARQQSLSRSIRQLQMLCKGQLPHNPEIKDETEQVVRLAEFLISSGIDPLQSAPSVPQPTPEPTSLLPEERLLEERVPEDWRPEELQSPLTRKNREGITLALRISNMGRLRNALNQDVLLNLLDERLPHIQSASQLYNGKLEYSAEGNAYITFSRDRGINIAVFDAICCATLIRKLVSEDKGDGLGLTIEQGISTLTPAVPGTAHPSLADSASSQALMLASLGRGRMLMDGEFDEQQREEIQATLKSTEFGGDILEVTDIPEQHQALIERQSRQIIPQSAFNL